MMAHIKAVLIALALSLAVALGAGVVWVCVRDTLHRQEEAITDLTAQVEAQKIANAALLSQSATRATRNAATAARTQGRTDALNTALKANGPWAAQRVPDDVAAALGVYGTVEGSKPASGP